MKRLIDRMKSIVAGDNFFQEKYLCPRDTAVARFGKALIEARKFYLEEREIAIDKEFIHDTWSDNISRLEAYFIKDMDEEFMLNKIINGTMVFTDKRSFEIELAELSKRFDQDRIVKIVSKDSNSAFIQGKARKATRINSVHHLYHLAKFEQLTGRKIEAMKAVVEFGGGYGNMARILQNYGAVKEYSIIDLPLFSGIQYAFLSATAGQDQVSLYKSNNKAKGKFNLIPLSNIRSLDHLHGELFLSTWALSESTGAVFKQVVQYDWFGAKNLLLSYNAHWKPWQDNELIASLEGNGWKVAIEAIPFLPESFYLFATR